MFFVSDVAAVDRTGTAAAAGVAPIALLAVVVAAASAAATTTAADLRDIAVAADTSYTTHFAAAALVAAVYGTVAAGTAANAAAFAPAFADTVGVAAAAVVADTAAAVYDRDSRKGLLMAEQEIPAGTVTIFRDCPVLPEVRASKHFFFSARGPQLCVSYPLYGGASLDTLSWLFRFDFLVVRTCFAFVLRFFCLPIFIFFAVCERSGSVQQRIFTFVQLGTSRKPRKSYPYALSFGRKSRGVQRPPSSPAASIPLSLTVVDGKHTHTHRHDCEWPLLVNAAVVIVRLRAPLALGVGVPQAALSLVLPKRFFRTKSK